RNRELTRKNKRRPNAARDCVSWPLWSDFPERASDAPQPVAPRSSPESIPRGRDMRWMARKRKERDTASARTTKEQGRNAYRNAPHARGETPGKKPRASHRHWAFQSAQERGEGSTSAGSPRRVRSREC